MKKIKNIEKLEYNVKKIPSKLFELELEFKYMEISDNKQKKFFIKKNKEIIEVKDVNIIENFDKNNIKIYVFNYLLKNINKKETIQILIQDGEKNIPVSFDKPFDSQYKQLGLVINKHKISYYNYYNLSKFKKLKYLIFKNPKFLFNYIKSKTKSKLKAHKVIRFILIIIYKIIKIPYVIIKRFFQMFIKPKKIYNRKLYIGTKPKVSIIIPAYNASKYLREAINSALAQTYPNIEVIVINDGSKDHGKTEKIAKSYGNKIKYFSKENGGVSTALNLGLSKMTGEYFSWLSHDDKYYPTKVEEQINYLNDNKLFGQKIILYSDYDLMDSHSKIFATSIKNHDELEAKQEYGLLRGAINGLSLLIPREAFNECGSFDENLFCTQDYALWKRMMQKYKFIHQAKVLVTTRIHSLQTGNTSPKVLQEGNPLWIDLIESIPTERKKELEGTEYNFYAKMNTFLKTTPYNEANEYVINKMKQIENIQQPEIKNKLVSIIIPFYNRIDLVVNSVQSALNQTHKNIEILLINDGSTTSTEELDKLIKDNDKIRYIKLEKNFGASHARNVGITESNGEYIAFLDSDDLFKEDKIEKQLNEMCLKGYKFSHTSYIRKNKFNETIIDTSFINENVIPQIISSCGIATPTIMIKRDFLLTNSLFYDENKSIGEDVCFYLEIAKKEKFLGICDPLSIVNTNDNSAAYNKSKQMVGIKTIITFILNDEKLSTYDYDIGLLFKAFIALHDIDSGKKIFSNFDDVEKIKNSLSWKITKPLRQTKKIYNIYKSEGIIYVIKKIIRRMQKGD